LIKELDMTATLYNFARHVSGEPALIRAPIDPTFEYRNGDLVALINSKAYPADAFYASDSSGGTQEGFHDVFLGVCVDERIVGTNITSYIGIATTGEFTYPCKAQVANHDIGTPMGPATDPAGVSGELSNQLLDVVATVNLSVGILSRLLKAGDTICHVKISGVLSTPWGGDQVEA